MTDLGRNPYYWSKYRHRRAYIVDLLKDEPRLEVADILVRVQATFGVDERTVRRDVEALYAEGLVRRTLPRLAAATDVEAATTRAMEAIRRTALAHGPLQVGESLPTD